MRPGRCIGILMLWLCSLPVQGQSVRSLIGDGNDKYEDGKFDDAEISYRKALEEEQGLMEGHFNLGNALHKQRKFDQSAHEFETAATTAKEKEAQASAYYNMGNTFTEAGQFKEAIKAYTESLKRNSGSADAKYNLSYALRKLQEQKQQQDKQDQQKQKPQQNEQDKNQQQQNEQQQNAQQKEQERQQSENQQRQNKPQDSQQQQAPPNQMSKADAERILDVVKNNEKEVQKKIQVRPRKRARTERDW